MWDFFLGEEETDFLSFAKGKATSSLFSNCANIEIDGDLSLKIRLLNSIFEEFI